MVTANNLLPSMKNSPKKLEATQILSSLKSMLPPTKFPQLKLKVIPPLNSGPMVNKTLQLNMKETETLKV